MKQVTVEKGRVTTLYVALGTDVSGEEITSEIRLNDDHNSLLIGTWDVNFVSDGTDGELVLTFDDSDRVVTQFKGYMDIKRDNGSGPTSAFDGSLEVIFEPTVTE